MNITHEKTMKQTAVEWLMEQLTKNYPLTKESAESIIEQAKAMEKEQIKDAFVQCWKANIPDGIECKLDAEQYYNETYESKTNL